MLPENTPIKASAFLVNRAAFRESAKEIAKPFFKKSYAQVASSASPRVSPEVAPHSTAGLHPRPGLQKRNRSYGLKLRDGDLEIIRERANAYRMSVNAYLRAKALGEDYIEKPPSWLRDILLKLYGELAGQGNNLNQLARKVNCGFVSAEQALATADKHRAPVFQALEKIQLALAGRRPPDDY